MNRFTIKSILIALFFMTLSALAWRLIGDPERETELGMVITGLLTIGTLAAKSLFDNDNHPRPPKDEE